MIQVLSLWKGVIHRYQPIDSMKEIALPVCERNRITLADLKGDDRRRAVSHPRQEFYAICKDAGHAYAAIGRWCGGRDHTTVIYGARVYKRRLTGG